MIAQHPILNPQTLREWVRGNPGFAPFAAAVNNPPSTTSTAAAVVATGSVADAPGNLVNVASDASAGASISYAVNTGGPPVIVATVQDGAGGFSGEASTARVVGAQKSGTGPYTVTAQIYAFGGDGSNVSVAWIAVN